MHSPHSIRRLTLWLLLAIVGLTAIALGGFGWHVSNALPAGMTAEYVGRNRCIQCHQVEYEKWKGSHHDRAMEVADSKTVLGDFADKTFEVNGVTSKFFQKEGKYFVHTEGREGKMETFELSYTFGFEPLQQYLAKFPDGRYQALPIAWDTHKKEWFHLYEQEKLKPDEWLYWTHWGMNWNHQCAECHSTNLQKNYDPKTDAYHTTWTDIDVSCEACHGPGSIHVAVAEKGSILGDWRYGTGLPSLKGTSQGQTQIDMCSRCHSRRRVIRPGFTPGDAFVEYYQPELLDTNAYYPDGQIRDEDYEYGSFHLSLMHAKGVRCVDCHDPHSAQIILKGNALCVRCHVPGKYDAPSHHFHKVDGKGSLCVECHMPETTYMRVDPRRDHSFRIPRPDLTQSMGIPNACNRCHKEKSAEWSMEHVTKWYGKKEYPRRIDFADSIAKGRDGDPAATKELTRLSRDPRMPAMLRASSVALLRNLPAEQTVETLLGALKDPDVLVRTQALRSLEPVLTAGGLARDDGRTPDSPWREQVRRVAGMLNDPSRSVRTEAARVLTACGRNAVPSALRDAFDRSLNECIADLDAQRDVPDTNYNLGNIYANLGDPSKAEAYYKDSLDRDPSFNIARFNLAMLYYEQQRNEKRARRWKRYWKAEKVRTDDFGRGGVEITRSPAERIIRLASCWRRHPRISRSRRNISRRPPS
ncbi:MAG: multiheme c-type cytochrome [Planctomycetota bacterium]